ncbi:MAG: endonuclease/exonuclease/phosphatase family protein [bacterium]
MKIKLLQWNILYKEKIENIVELLKEINADIVCLQELGIGCRFNPTIDDTPAYVASQLGYNYYFERAHTKSDTTDMKAIGNAIFTRFPINKKGHFYVQEPKPIQNSFQDEGRVYIETELQINNTSVNIATVHLSYVHKFQINDQKKVEIDNFISHIKNNKEKYIVMGDFNSTPDSYTISELSKYFVDCGPEYKEPTWTTKPFDYQGFFEDELRWRLDYIFATKDIKIQSSEIVKTNYSDHLPILVTFEV